MGCQISKQSLKACPVSRYGDFTHKHRSIVQAMWSECKPEAKKFGIAAFIRLFDEVPETQDLFYDYKDIKDQDELIKSLEELDHVAKVMNAFGKCIELLDNDEQYINMVQRLGVAHKKIGITIPHLEVFGKIVIEHLSKVYESKWTKEKHRAWTKYFELLCTHFAIGLHSQNTTT